MTPHAHRPEYAEYLRLDELFRAQHTLSTHPDELHFIIVHQVHELWFKLALHHLDRARAALRTDAVLEAVRLVGQVNVIIENLIGTAQHLHTLPPEAFHHFRSLLAPGSGLQSYQFRALEMLAGRRDAEYVAWVRRVLANEPHLPEVEAQLAQPSLAEELDAALARYAITPAEIYAHPANVPDLYALCDALSVLDQVVVRWRFAHIQLVERTIGAGVVGTGGTTHDFLQRTLGVRFFPALWAARDTLSARYDAPARE